MSKFDKYIIFNYFSEHKDALISDEFDPNYIYDYRYTSANLLMTYDKLQYFNLFIKNNDKLFKNMQIQQNMWYVDLHKITTIMSNFVTRCKIKYSKSQNDTNTFFEYHDDKTSIYLFENGTKYTFSYSEIKQIIVNNIYTLNEGTISINRIRNPYTNLPFKQYNLYNIYHKIKYNDTLFKTIIDLYYLNFDYIRYFDIFKRRVLVISLEKEYANITPDKKNKYLISLIRHYGRKDYLNIDEKVLISIFEKYLKNFYVYCNYHLPYDIQENVMRKHRRMRIFMKKFRDLNPRFGRDIIYRQLNDVKHIVFDKYLIPS